MLSPAQNNAFVAELDPEVGTLLQRELERQRESIELIASENLTSRAVMACMGSALTNKYAEGLPGRRYYGGCEAVDEIERIAIARAKALFGAEFVNVQPHSGTQANLAVYQALLRPNDTILAMRLSDGGHLSHGSAVNASGKLYRVVSYGVDPATGRIDYDEVERLAQRHHPKLIVAGASAYPRRIDFARFADIAHACGAYFMVDMAHIAGLVAGGQHPSPIPYADVVTTTTHKTLRGPRGGVIMGKAELEKKLNSAVFPGTQGGPLMHVIAAKAVCFGEALKPEFRAYAAQVVKNAAALAQALQKRGFPLVSGGTDNHLMLVDLRPLGLTGLELQTRLDENHITINKNALPDDTFPPSVCGGVRIGTPAVTTRGMGEREMETLAACITDTARDFEGTRVRVRAAVDELTRRFPLYAE